jgi:hypothetical protein
MLDVFKPDRFFKPVGFNNLNVLLNVLKYQRLNLTGLTPNLLFRIIITKQNPAGLKPAGFVILNILS